VNITNVYNNVYVNKNVTNVNVNAHFANMAAPNAVVAMSQTSFASGRPVKQGGGISVPANQVAQVSTHMAVAPSVAPVRQALAPMAGNRPAPHPPARAVSMQVVAKKTPPPAPIPFAAKQAALQQNAGRPLNVQTIRQSVPQSRTVAVAPAVRVAPPARQVVPQVHAAQPTEPARTPNAPPSPANRPPTAEPPVQPAQTNPRPAQTNPPATPAYRPPNATPPARPAPESTPRPENRPPAATPPARPAPESTPRPENRPPAAAPPARPAPESAPHPAQPQQKPPAKPTQKPKKETEKEK
jgi:hypothetical protein